MTSTNAPHTARFETIRTATKDRTLKAQMDAALSMAQGEADRSGFTIPADDVHRLALDILRTATGGAW